VLARGIRSATRATGFLACKDFVQLVTSLDCRPGLSDCRDSHGQLSLPALQAIVRVKMPRPPRSAGKVMITQREISQIVGKSGKHERAAARLDPARMRKRHNIEGG